MTLLYKQIPFDIREEKLRDWSEEFLKIRPYKPCVPVLVDNTLIIEESHIIMQYIDDQSEEKKLTPETAADKAKMRTWIFWSSGELRDAIEMYKYARGGSKEEGLEKVKACFQKLDEQIKMYILDNISLADFGVWPFVRQALRVGELSLDNYPALNKWYTNIESLPEFTSLMEK